MKRYAVLIALCLVSAVTQAKGLPYAVESLQKAQALSKQTGSKHVLVFYSSEN